VQSEKVVLDVSMGLGAQGETATENGINNAVRNDIQNGNNESESSCSVTKKGQFHLDPLYMI
jgi:hypothetical protein